jgi:hypothetical protein
MEREAVSSGVAGFRRRPPGRPAKLALAILRDVLAGYRPRDFSVRWWDGTVWEAETSEPRFALVLNATTSW